MKKLCILAFFTLATLASAQTGKFSFAGVVSSNKAYLVAVAPIYTEWQSGRLSLHSDLLFGARVTDPAGAVGIAQTLSYQLSKDFSAFVGIADMTTTQTISPSAWLADTHLCFAAGISGPIDLSILGLR